MLIAKGADGQLIGGPCAGSPRPSAQVRLVRPSAQWHLLHRARRRAERHGDSARSAYGLRETFCITLAFLDWIDRRDVDLASVTQHDDYSRQLRRCLHDPDLPADARAAGALILLYGLRTTEVVALRRDQLIERWQITISSSAPIHSFSAASGITSAPACSAPHRPNSHPALWQPEGRCCIRVSAPVSPLRPARSAHACSSRITRSPAATPRV